MVIVSRARRPAIRRWIVVKEQPLAQTVHSPERGCRRRDRKQTEQQNNQHGQPAQDTMRFLSFVRVRRTFSAPMMLRMLDISLVEHLEQYRYYLRFPGIVT